MTITSACAYLLALPRLIVQHQAHTNLHPFHTTPLIIVAVPCYTLLLFHSVVRLESLRLDLPQPDHLQREYTLVPDLHRKLHNLLV